VAALRGRLPGSEPRPYILRFDEDKPNPLYRRVCYTFAWSAVLTFALLNLSGLLIAAVTGTWYMKQVYHYAYFPLCVTILLLGAAGMLPRVRPSTKGEGTERRYFYGSVWAVTAAQTILLVLWKALPQTHAASVAKVGVFVGALLLMGLAAYRGMLPRTRPIIAGELMVSD
jgi:glucan phosphoethanolaminetransferase (alkaline phosphatase superfamily)